MTLAVIRPVILAMRLLMILMILMRLESRYGIRIRVGMRTCEMHLSILTRYGYCYGY